MDLQITYLNHQMTSATSERMHLSLGILRCTAFCHFGSTLWSTFRHRLGAAQCGHGPLSHDSLIIPDDS